MPRRRDPDALKVVHRSARVELRLTRAQRRRCFAQMESAADLWACVLELNALRRRRGDRPLAGYQELCRELARSGPGCFGELSVVGARSVLRRYSDSFFAAARARREGDTRARFPRRRRRLMPVRFYGGTFSLEGGRVRLPVAAGVPPLRLRLTRSVPYPAHQVRSLTLLHEGRRVYVEITAEVPVADHGLDSAVVAGVDLGIIHPYALAGPEQALLVSGRAIRAEGRLHLFEVKARNQALASRAPRRGQRGSRRWRKAAARLRAIEARHRRRVRQAHHEAAREALSWATGQGVGKLVIGHPQGITKRNAGRRHNLALRNWRRAHLVSALKDKAEAAGIEVVLVDERGTSSTCPECQSPVPKPGGRGFCCPTCGHRSHRDIVGARNIAARGGGPRSAPVLLTHRRAGRHLPGRTRRDPRRVRMGASRGPWPAVARTGQSGESLVAPRERDEEPRTSLQQGERLWSRH